MGIFSFFKREEPVREYFEFLTEEERGPRNPVLARYYANMHKEYVIEINRKSPVDENKIIYNLAIKYLGFKDGCTLWEISKSDYFINNEMPEDQLCSMALACAAAYYPLKFTANFEGDIIDITNIQELQKRFAEIKQLLLRNFKGETAIQYINETALALKDPEQIKKLITTDMWFSLFFAPLSGEYNWETITKPIKMDFPFLGFEESLVFEGTAAMDAQEANNTMAITVEGILNNAVESKAVGNLKAFYKMDSPENHLNGLRCSASLFNADGEHAVWIRSYLKAEKTVYIPPKEKPVRVGWASIFDD